jgi:phosphate transport system ATP-binding protein
VTDPTAPHRDGTPPTGPASPAGPATMQARSDDPSLDPPDGDADPSNRTAAIPLAPPGGYDPTIPVDEVDPALEDVAPHAPAEHYVDRAPVLLVGGPPAGAATLEAQDACAWFGDHLVLEGVDLVMPAGQVSALIGPSGCGKSTFLRLLNRMHELVPGATLAGQVLIDGEDIYRQGIRAQQIRMRIGMVFQKPNPFPAMSIRDNVLSGLKLARIRCRDKDGLVEQSLVRAGLWREVRDRLGSPGGALSGGQQQRLCIARALAVQPNVLLMDEPCSALDPTSTRRIEDTIAELRHQVTVVIVTHNMQQAYRVSDRCAFFLAAEGEPGRVVEQGSTEAMFSEPEDPRTLAYVEGRFG